MSIFSILGRDETNDDADAITEVTVTAFLPMEISRHTEQLTKESNT